MKIFIKKPTGYFPYGNGYFKKYLEELLISFGFGEEEYKIRVPHSLTLYGDPVDGNTCILIFDEKREREGKNIDGLLEEILKYKKIFQWEIKKTA